MTRDEAARVLKYLWIERDENAKSMQQLTKSFFERQEALRIGVAALREPEWVRTADKLPLHFSNTLVVMGGKITLGLYDCNTRRPRLTDEQVRVLEALYEVFDFKWLAKQKDGQVMAYANRPNKSDDWYGCWFSGEGDNEEDYGWKVKASSPVCGLISWSDPAPLDIVQVLRQNILEVEG